MAQKRKDNRGRILRDNEFQRPDGRYMFRYYNQQGEKKYVYSWRLTENDKMPQGKRDDISLREKEKQITEDKVHGVDTSKSKVTLTELFEKHMKLTKLKQSTRTNYRYMYTKYVAPRFGNVKVTSIKKSDIQGFYNGLIEERHFKPNSMEIIHTILHPVFQLAVDDDVLVKNPTDGVMKKIKKMYNWEKPKRHALTIEQQSAFVSFVKNSPTYNHWLPIFTVALGTGLRVGELIGLRIEDCNFKDKTISVNHNLVYRQQDSGICEMHVTTPKTKAGVRTVPMLSEVEKTLKTEIQNQMTNGLCTCEIDGYRGFIFSNRENYVHNPQTLNRAIKRIIRDYNAQETELAVKENREPRLLPDFSMHHFRHTFCTRFCENETNIKVIQEIMGHSDISTTMDVYAEATEQRKKDVFANLENKIKIS